MDLRARLTTLGMASQLSEILHLDPSEVAETARTKHLQTMAEDMDDEPADPGSPYYFAVREVLAKLMGMLAPPSGQRVPAPPTPKAGSQGRERSAERVERPPKERRVDRALAAGVYAA
eukprot:15264106-Alexandrium_andersonii.AAC.1